jgi:hypothetical protein
MMHPGNIMHRKELGGCEVARATDLAGRDRACRRIHLDRTAGVDAQRRKMERS